MKTKKYLVIAHDILSEIAHHEIFETLGKEANPENTKIISFRPEIELKHGETMGVSWLSLRTTQSELFKNEIEPILPEYKEDIICYFGLAPIPLAVHLGLLMSSFTDVKVYLKHHTEMNWKWPSISVPAPTITGLPSEKFLAEGNVTLRFGTSYVVHPESTSELVIDPLKDVNLSAAKTGIDIFGSQEDLRLYVEKFRYVIDEIKNHLPKANGVHLFASIPVGLAFMIGQQINTNVHRPLHVYEYSTNHLPAYKEAFILSQDEVLELDIPENKRDEILKLRLLLADELEKVKGFAENQITKEKKWFRNLFPSVSVDLFDSSLWNPLASIGDTDLKTSVFTDKPHDVNESKFYVGGKWYLPDVFLYQLMIQFSHDEILRAIRLFWFHEALHVKTHIINSQNSEEIGRYPRILEEADYQADVYALLNEYKFQQIQKKNTHEFFMSGIQIMISTMWTFDEISKHDEIQVRRMNRYLIWYFQLCLIEKEPMELEEIMEILARKPLLEMKLHGITTADRKRIMFNLKIDRKSELGIAVFYQNRMEKHGYNGGQLSLDRLIEGFRERNNDAIKEVMCQLISEIL